MRVLISTAVWGEPFIDKFLEFTLPNLMSKGNLGGASWLDGSRFLIATTAQGAEQIDLDQRTRRPMSG